MDFLDKVIQCFQFTAKDWTEKRTANQILENRKWEHLPVFDLVVFIFNVYTPDSAMT
jgi:hypothetical protein